MIVGDRVRVKTSCGAPRKPCPATDGVVVSTYGEFANVRLTHCNSGKKAICSRAISDLEPWNTHI